MLRGGRGDSSDDEDSYCTRISAHLAATLSFEPSDLAEPEPRDAAKVYPRFYVDDSCEREGDFISDGYEFTSAGG